MPEAGIVAAEAGEKRFEGVEGAAITFVQPWFAPVSFARLQPKGALILVLRQARRLQLGGVDG